MKYGRGYIRLLIRKIPKFCLLHENVICMDLEINSVKKGNILKIHYRKKVSQIKIEKCTEPRKSHQPILYIERNFLCENQHFVCLMILPFMNNLAETEMDSSIKPVRGMS